MFAVSFTYYSKCPLYADCEIYHEEKKIKKVGTMDADVFCDYVCPILREQQGITWLLDNAPVHYAKTTIEEMERMGIRHSI